ncbi:hypothetical protein GN956_G25618 [Arapaima gigas]
MTSSSLHSFIASQHSCLCAPSPHCNCNGAPSVGGLSRSPSEGAPENELSQGRTPVPPGSVTGNIMGCWCRKVFNHPGAQVGYYYCLGPPGGLDRCCPVSPTPSSPSSTSSVLQEEPLQ